MLKSAFAIPSTELSVTLTEWTIPTANSLPSDVAVDSFGNMWFTESAGFTAERARALDFSSQVAWLDSAAISDIFRSIALR